MRSLGAENIGYRHLRVMMVRFGCPCHITQRHTHLGWERDGTSHTTYSNMVTAGSSDHVGVGSFPFSGCGVPMEFGSTPGVAEFGDSPGRASRCWRRTARADGPASSVVVFGGTPSKSVVQSTCRREPGQDGPGELLELVRIYMARDKRKIRLDELWGRIFGCLANWVQLCSW